MPTPEEYRKARTAYEKNIGSAATPSEEAKTYLTMLMKDAGIKVPDKMIITMRAVGNDDKVLQYVVQDAGTKEQIAGVDIPMIPVRAEEGRGPAVRGPGKDGRPGPVIQRFDKDDKKITDKKMGMGKQTQDMLRALADEFKSEAVPPGTFLAMFKGPGDGGRGSGIT